MADEIFRGPPLALPLATLPPTTPPCRRCGHPTSPVPPGAAPPFNRRGRYVLCEFHALEAFERWEHARDRRELKPATPRDSEICECGCIFAPYHQTPGTECSRCLDACSSFKPLDRPAEPLHPAMWVVCTQCDEVLADCTCQVFE